MMRLVVTRALVSVFWLASALYALLSAIPFAYTQFLEPQLVPAINTFAAWHVWLSVVTLAATATGLAPWLRRGRTGASVFLGVWTASIVVEIVTGGFASLRPSSIAVAVAIAALVPAVWLSMLNLGVSEHTVRTAPRDPGPAGDFVICAAAAVCVAVTHAAMAWQGAPDAAWVAGVWRSLLLHMLVFSAVFAVISIVRGLATMARRREALEAWLTRGAVALLLAVFMQHVVLASLSFTGAAATVVAGAFGLALAVMLAPAGGAMAGGIEAGLSSFAPSWACRSRLGTLAWTIGALAGLATLERFVAQSDWNFTAGKLVALLTWLVALAAMQRLPSTPESSATARRPATAAAAFAACLVVLAAQQFGVSLTAAASNEVLAAWTSRDVSSRLIVDALAPAAAADAGLYEYLQANTNIPRSTQVAPVDVSFAPLAAKSGRKQPHIFLFVVDSLRRDYLSPYNDRVTFTPSIERFAADATVFERAFTRYGGTGLAVPSIWVGGLVLHKQYVTPFAPMNTLDKLLEAEGYARAITMEHIVETVLPAGVAVQPLDAGLPVKDHRLCGTLDDVRGRLDALRSSDRPGFFYSLPQDVHISTITREGTSPVDAARYDGFNAPYASRVRRLDACFGAFVDDLKARDLYDDSIVILTSDHGDSLGEQGRMGHAYTIFPEVVQVPLLVHLPASLRSEYRADPTALAFTSDLAPSLYALLGHEPASPAPIFGRPLFGRSAVPLAGRTGPEVIASSYGSVYGALLDGGRRLYILDAVQFQEHAYELDGTAGGRPVTVSSRDREIGQRAVRTAIERLSTFYRYAP
jgi:hypothetical protein